MASSDENDNVVELADWRKKKQQQYYKTKVVWVSDSDPKLICKLNTLDLTIELIGYDENHKKKYYKNLTLLEVATLLQSIQNEYSKF